MDTQLDQSQLDQERLRLATDSLQQERAAWASENARIRSELDAEWQQLNSEREAATHRVQDFERQEDQHRGVMQAQLSQLEREQQEWVSHRLAEEQRLQQESTELEAAAGRLKQEQQAHLAQTAGAIRSTDEQGTPLCEAQERLDCEGASLEDLRREQAEFHQAVQTWGRQSAELDARTTALERRLAQFGSEADQDSETSGPRSDEELQAARAEVQAQKRVWQETQAEEFKKVREEQDALWRQLEHLRGQLKAEQSEIAAERARLEAVCHELETRHQLAPLDEAAAPGPRDFRPGADHDWDHDRLAEKGARRSRSSEHAAHDQSIEMYMAALFGRMEERESCPGAGGLRSRKAVPGERTELPLSGEAWGDIPAIELPSEPVEMIRRASIETANFGAMRALANTHATLVLGTHRNQQLLRRAVFVWSAAIVCVCLTIFVLLIAPANDALARTGVMVVAIASIYFIFAGPVATQRWLATRRRERKRLRAMVDSPSNEPSKGVAGQSSGSRPD